MRLTGVTVGVQEFRAVVAQAVGQVVKARKHGQAQKYEETHGIRESVTTANEHMHGGAAALRQ